MNVSQHMTAKDTVNWTGGMGRRLQFVAKDGDCIDVWFADLATFEKCVDAVTQMHTDWVFSQMGVNDENIILTVPESDVFSKGTKVTLTEIHTGEELSAEVSEAEALDAFEADQESIDRHNTCRWDGD